MAIKKKITELPACTNFNGLWTIGVDGSRKSVKVSLGYIKEVVDGMIEATDDANDAADAANTAAQRADTSRQQIEANENTRQQNETTRQSNEQTRGQNENTRQQNESARGTAETQRAQNESGRTSAENARVQAENERVTSENTRKSNETTRGQNESTRQQNESTRQSNEQTRTNQENARVQAETTRQTTWTEWFSDTLATGVRKLWNDFWSSINSSWNGFFGTSADDANGVRKIWSTFYNSTLQAWDGFFGSSADDANGVRKIWTTWYIAVQSNWASFFGSTSSEGVRGEWGTLKNDVQSATSNANSAASLANQKANLADTKATEAGRVNATLEGTTLTVVNRNGESKSVDTKGEKGDPGDVTDFFPESVSAVAPTGIPVNATQTRKVVASLSPSSVPQNIIYQVEGESLTVSPSGVITPKQIGISLIHVIPTLKTELYETLIVEIVAARRDKVLMINDNDIFLLMGSGDVFFI